MMLTALLKHSPQQSPSMSPSKACDMHTYTYIRLSLCARSVALTKPIENAICALENHITPSHIKSMLNQGEQ
jgi:hypothetical protein